MTVYNILLLLILALAVPLCLYKPKPWKKIAYLVLVMGYMFFIIAFRKNIGFDYDSYINIAQQVAGASTRAELFAIPLEPGFVLLTRLIVSISMSPTFMYAAYAVLTLVPIGIFIYRQSQDVWLSIWLYVTMAFMYTNMNFIRQSLACAIIVCGYDFLSKKNRLPFVAKAALFTLIALLAGTFHVTALVMIPIFFLVHIPLNKVRVSVYCVAALLGFLLSEQIIDLVTDFAYKSYKGQIYVVEGLSLAFLLLPVMTLAICISLFWTWRKRDEDAPMLLNMAIISATIWLFSVRHMIIERFSMYNYIFMIIAIPAALNSLKASPEIVAEHAALQLTVNNTRGKPKQSDIARFEKLTAQISDHKQYYWSAVVAVILITFLYNNFGMHVNGFHRVFPYQSIFEWFPF